MEGLRIFTDGASRGNPGLSSAGFVLVDSAGKVRLKYGKKLGIQTNNFAEYMAVITALEKLQTFLSHPSHYALNFSLDSNLVVSQLSGSYKIKNSVIMELVGRIRDLEKFFGHVDYKHIPREENKAADKLVNEVLNKNTDIEVAF